jgi:hypothetical protein
MVKPYSGVFKPRTVTLSEDEGDQQLHYTEIRNISNIAMLTTTRIFLKRAIFLSRTTIFC